MKCASKEFWRLCITINYWTIEPFELNPSLAPLKADVMALWGIQQLRWHNFAIFWRRYSLILTGQCCTCFKAVLPGMAKKRIRVKFWIMISFLYSNLSQFTSLWIIQVYYSPIVQLLPNIPGPTFIFCLCLFGSLEYLVNK